MKVRQIIPPSLHPLSKPFWAQFKYQRQHDYFVRALIMINYLYSIHHDYQKLIFGRSILSPSFAFPLIIDIQVYPSQDSVFILDRQLLVHQTLRLADYSKYHPHNVSSIAWHKHHGMVLLHARMLRYIYIYDTNTTVVVGHRRHS
jgi:hypothetical protein